MTKLKKYITAALLLAAAVPAAGQTVEEYMDQGREAYLNYNFDEAQRLFDLARKKARKAIPEGIEEDERKLSLAKSFLDRVEKLVILDSISVPKAEFFKAYRLPASSGRLTGADGLPFEEQDVDYVFTNEGGDFKMWSQPDSTGFYRINEAIRLADGKWHAPVQADSILNNGGDAIFPFMMADGVTLYFAADNEESLGGYDIFVATRDATDGSYLQPQNIGMPYNSPYDDYLLAIDELNGVGWWATDRNQLGDSLTVYLFKINDLRKNYDPEEEGLEQLAAITDYKATWAPEEDYTAIIEEIMAIDPTAEKKRADFHFPLSGGRVYTTLDDFSGAGRTAMQNYLAAKKTFDDNAAKLEGMRRKFATSKASSLKQNILDAEQALERERESLRKLRNAVYEAER